MFCWIRQISYIKSSLDFNANTHSDHSFASKLFSNEFFLLLVFPVDITLKIRYILILKLPIQIIEIYLIELKKLDCNKFIESYKP